LLCLDDARELALSLLSRHPQLLQQVCFPRIDRGKLIAEIPFAVGAGSVEVKVRLHGRYEPVDTLE